MCWNGMIAEILYISKWKQDIAQSIEHAIILYKRGTIDIFISLEAETDNLASGEGDWTAEVRMG